MGNIDVVNTIWAWVIAPGLLSLALGGGLTALVYWIVVSGGKNKLPENKR